MQDFFKDLRSGLRQLLKQPWSSAFAIGALALSIGAITALFAVANALLLEPVRGIRDPASLLETGRTSDGRGFDTISNPLLRVFNQPSDQIEGMYGWELLPVNLVAGAEPTRAFGFLVSENYFDVLGVKAERGRLFSATADGKRGASPHAVISYAAWQKHFGGDPQVVGRAVVLNGQSFTVIGVADRAFGSQVSLLSPDVFVPLSMQRQVKPSNGDLLDVVSATWLLTGARLKPGVTLAQAQAELTARFEAFRKLHPEEFRAEDRFGAAPLRALPADIASEFGLFGGVMLILVALVMLVACVNIASMMLARGEARGGELSVRSALGAHRARLVRMLFHESLLIAALATFGGVLIASFLLGAIDLGALPTPFPMVLSIGLGARPLLASMAAATLAVLVFGMWPAWRSVRSRLSESGRGIVASRSRAREVLVIAQVALTLVLLVASALFMRALDRAHAIELGFRVDNVYTADLDLEPTGYDSPRQQQVALQLAEALRALPGVEHATYSRMVPLSGSTFMMGLVGDETTPEAARFAATNVVAEDYFSTFDIRVDGEVFGSTHRNSGEHVAIINAVMAKALFGNESPIGRSIKYDGNASGTLRIIGVAAPSRYARLSETPPPFLYLPAGQYEAAQYTLVIHSALPALEIARNLHAVFERVDRNLPKPTLHAMRDTVALNLLPQRLASGVAGALGMLGLLLAGIGTYGLIAHFVASRTREIGVRLSMGATQTRIEHDVLKRGLRLGSIGLVIGLVFAGMLAVGVSGLVFGLVAGDAIAFVGAAAVLALAIVTASWFPARKASRISPMTALRYE